MKNLMNTVLALCFNTLSFGQYYESTLFNYSDSLANIYESRFDSLPYKAALDIYFNDIANHKNNEACKSLPEYYFNLTKAEFLYKQGDFKSSLEILNEFLSTSAYLIPYLPNDYLDALATKSYAELKSGNTINSFQSIQKADSIFHKYSAKVCRSTEINILNAKAFWYLKQDRYSESKMCLNSLIREWTPLNRREKIAYATSLMLFAENFLNTDQIDSAYTYLQHSQDLLQEFFIAPHIKYTRLYIDFALYYKFNGDLTESENYLLLAKKVCRKKTGELNCEYANILRLIANHNRRIGRFDIADINYNASINLLKQIGFENKTMFAIALINQGLMYTVIGKRKEAEKQFFIAKSNLELNGDTTDLDYSFLLENLGNLYYNQLKLDEAEMLYSRSLQIRCALQGEKNLDYAECINSLGNVYFRKSKHNLAESYYQQAIQIANNPDKINQKLCPHFYNNLATLYLKSNQFYKAESLYLLAKPLYEQYFGKSNRTYLSLIENLADLYARIQNPGEAEKYLIEASKLRKKIIYDSFKYLSSDEISSYLDRFKRGLTLFDNYLVSSNVLSDTLLKEVFENEIFYKGFLMNYHLELNRIIEGRPELAKLNDSIKATYKLLANEYTRLPLRNIKVEALESTAHILEKQMGHKMEDYKDLIRNVSYNDIIGKLKVNESIIEIMLLNMTSANGGDSIQYGAIISQYGQHFPKFVNLCSEYELKKLFGKNTNHNIDYVNNLYSSSTRGIMPKENDGNGLYQLIWSKLEPFLNNTHTIYYCPAGLLTAINIQAIPVAKNAVTGDFYNFIQLTNCRQLINYNKSKIKIYSALLMGGVQYDEHENDNMLRDKFSFNTRGLSESNSKTQKETNWPELSYTSNEVNKLHYLLQKNKIRVKKFVGYDASEESFKNELSGKSDPSIIHIATHGYFVPESKLKNDTVNNANNCPFMNSKNSMLRSGLILANGNYAWNHCEVLPGHQEDGILTAFEISQMNLRNVGLAVLSACDSGLGDIKGSEGVFGLQRAFKIAGVRYLLMSLWQIPDQQTQELMVLFYTNMLQYKMEIPKAFKKAQMDMKSKYNDPYFWAGFVLVQ